MKTRPAIKITGGLAALALAGLLAACGTATTATPASSAKVEAKAPKTITAAEKAEAKTAAKRERAQQLIARGQRLAQEIVRLSARGQADPLSACDSVVPAMRKRMASFSTVVDKLGGYTQYADDPGAQRKLLGNLRDYRDQMSASFSKARTGCAQLKALARRRRRRHALPLGTRRSSWPRRCSPRLSCTRPCWACSSTRARSTTSTPTRCGWRPTSGRKLLKARPEARAPAARAAEPRGGEPPPGARQGLGRPAGRTGVHQIRYEKPAILAGLLRFPGASGGGSQTRGARLSGRGASTVREIAFTDAPPPPRASARVEGSHPRVVAPSSKSALRGRVRREVAAALKV